MGRTKGSKNGVRKVPMKKTQKLEQKKALKCWAEENLTIEAQPTQPSLPYFEPHILELYRHKDYEKCILLIDEVLENEDNENKDHYKILQAGAYTMLGENFEEAHRLLDEVLGSDKTNSHAMYSKGVAFYFEKKTSESVQILNKALELNKEGMVQATDMKQRMDLESRKAVIMVQKMNQDLDISEDELDLFTDITSDISIVKSLNGQVFNDTFEIDPMEGLEDTFEASVDSSKNSLVMTSPKAQIISEEVIDEIVEVSTQIKDPQISVSLPKSVAPKSADAFFAEGMQLFLAGFLQKALKMFGKAVKLDPDMTQADDMGEKAQELLELIDVAETNMDQKNYFAVVEILNEALEVCGTNDKIKRPLYYQRGLALFYLGMNEESMKDYAEYDRINKILAEK